MTAAKKGRILGDRVCTACGRNDGKDGPRPAGSMIKLDFVRNTLLYACSVPCAKSLNWRIT